MMRFEWYKVIPVKKPWAPELSGWFYRQGNHTIFFFANENQVHMLRESDIYSQPIFKMAQGQITLPASWYIYQHFGNWYLLLSESIGLDLCKFAHCPKLPIEAVESYRKQKKDKLRQGILWQDDSYCIKAKGQSGYVCEVDGQVIWSFTGQAYLYTPILRCEDNICFGTAGKGGWVYIISLHSGEVVTKVKTGGTVSLVQVGKRCYFVANSPSATLFCVDMITGDTLQEVSLGGKIDYSPLQLVENTLHTITYEGNNNIHTKALWHCISIDDK